MYTELAVQKVHFSKNPYHVPDYSEQLSHQILVSFKMGETWPLFVYFCIFVQQIISMVSRIRTQIVRVEGEDIDCLTTTATIF